MDHEKMTNTEKRPLELYIHIPFCARKCLYCDFLSFRTLAAVHEEYTAQLIREIRAQGSCCGDYQVQTIFIGGGTPSIMDPCLIRDIMQAVGESFEVHEKAEITIEVNPGTLLQNKLHIYRSCGINRVSIGLQSADNGELKELGRIHSFEEFLKSFQCARMAGFTEINIDLISGIPGQSLDSWKNTLKKVAMLKPEHISAYSLIIEEGTPYWERYGGRMAGKRSWLPLPDEDTVDHMDHLTRTLLQEQGYGRYEISNYAKPGHECRHNIGYWTEVPYLGLGLGSSSYMAGERFSNERDMNTYLSLDFETDGGIRGLEALHGPIQVLTREERMEEFMFLGLRMTRGISEIDFVSMFGVKLETVYGPVLSRLKANGLIRQEGVWYSLTEWGMDVSNFVLSEFLLS